MPLTIRDFRPADAEAVTEARRTAQPFAVLTAESLRSEAGQAPAGQHFRLLVAELDGRVAGMARTGLCTDRAEPGHAFLHPCVHPDFTGRGAGSALLSAAEGHLASLGAHTVLTWALDDGHSPGWAERRGYQRQPRSGHFLGLDLTGTGLPPLAEPPPGVELRPFTDFAADPRPLYALDLAVSQDEPGDAAATTTPFSYQEWLARYWHQPLLDRKLSIAAVADGTPVAFTAALTDRRGRYLSGMTGTARAHRGRGLARLAKNHSLHLARAAGCRNAFTQNDADNAPMLAVNRWFGYRPAATELRYARELG
ncbi:GNAT family N-acetyltransferase [Streptomyces orinoci]|uniref:GNAT family N-acetyltransferase n=1 Tax=Streptomyces orinoci TaxID=67339 RepID=A0ABV3K4E7_STRON|nr:GNAT family N-acetyltransferase [Streptomyces orinoci]